MARIARLGIAGLAALIVVGGGQVSTPTGVSADGGYSVHDHRVQALINPAIEREVLNRRDNDPFGLEGSGAQAIAHHAGGQPISSEGASDTLARSRLYRTGFFAIEPTLGVTKDGSIFYQTTDAREWPAFSTDVIRSTNDGRSWKAVGPRLGPESRHPITEDPYLYVDEKTGRVFTVDFLLPCSAISYSDDKGKSWTSTLSACDLVDHQTLFAGPPVTSPTIGYPNIVYYCSAGAGLARWSMESSCLKSLDGGKTFVRTGEPAFITDPRDGIPGQECSGVHGHGFADDDGTVYIPKGHCGKPWLAISRDEGR
ncbi:MAG: glycoside hydrolase, partial [Actinomycetota bacterium]|nr:glycoside hydrolase [Actinomycetota bacterium]